jgi:hypothetical protein
LGDILGVIYTGKSYRQKQSKTVAHYSNSAGSITLMGDNLKAVWAELKTLS